MPEKERIEFEVSPPEKKRLCDALELVLWYNQRGKCGEETALAQKDLEKLFNLLKCKPTLLT